jgi:hypothetical protein
MSFSGSVRNYSSAQASCLIGWKIKIEPVDNHRSIGGRLAFYLLSLSAISRDIQNQICSPYFNQATDLEI